MATRPDRNSPKGCPRKLFLFTKPAIAGRVKTRLIGELSAEQTAQLHQAFLCDVCKSVRHGDFDLTLAWALDDAEAVPNGVGSYQIQGVRQQGEDLGERLFQALAAGAQDGAHVAALGSDHPEISPQTLHDTFGRLDAEADVVLGPASDGGYFLIALRSSAVDPRIFQDIAWSTSEVLRQTLDRCSELELRAELLPMGHDVDVAEDLEALVDRLRRSEGGCSATRELLESWGRLERTDR